MTPKRKGELEEESRDSKRQNTTSELAKQNSLQLVDEADRTISRGIRYGDVAIVAKYWVQNYRRYRQKVCQSIADPVQVMASWLGTHSKKLDLRVVEWFGFKAYVSSNKRSIDTTLSFEGKSSMQLPPISPLIYEVPTYVHHHRSIVEAERTAERELCQAAKTTVCYQITEEKGGQIIHLEGAFELLIRGRVKLNDTCYISTKSPEDGMWTPHKFNYTGFIANETTDEVRCTFHQTPGKRKHEQQAPLKVGDQVYLEYQMNGVSLQRIHKALDEVTKMSSLPIHIGRVARADPSMAALNNESFGIFPAVMMLMPDLTEEQHTCIRTMLEKKVVVIEGCFGSGKSSLLSHFILALAILGFIVVVTAQSNLAVDNVIAKIMKIYDERRDTLSKFSFEELQAACTDKYKLDSSKFLSLTNPIGDSILRYCATTHTPQHPVSERVHHKLLDKWRHIPNFDEVEAMKDTFMTCRIFGVTCNSMAASKFKNNIKGMSIGWLIIEEASQLTETCLLPTHNLTVSNYVQAGDTKQLNPVALSGDAKRLGAGCSIQRKLVNIWPTVYLTVQSRMIPALSEIAHIAFYPELKNHEMVTLVSPFLVQNITPALLAPLDEGNLFLNVIGSEEKDSFNSYTNLTQNLVALKMAHNLLLAGYKGNQIAILSPYRGNIGQLYNLLLDIQKGEKSWRKKTNKVISYNTEEWTKVSNVSVDEIQGGEFDWTIIVTVRSDDMGFLQEENRLNVALTRAKRGRVMVGDSEFLLKEGSKYWNLYIRHVMDKGAVVNGITYVDRLSTSLLKGLPDMEK